MKRRIKLAVGDIVDHQEFGRGVVEREVCAHTFDVVFEEGGKFIKEDSRNILSVNDTAPSVLKRRQISDEQYSVSRYGRYNPTLHKLPFSETEYPELVQTLDAWCIEQGTMKIGCNPSYLESATKRLTTSGVPELVRYLHMGQGPEDGEEGHGLWVNIYIPDPKIDDLDNLLHVFFNPRALISSGRYLLCKLQYTTRLLGKMAMDAPEGDEAGETLVLG